MSTDKKAIAVAASIITGALTLNTAEAAPTVADGLRNSGEPSKAAVDKIMQKWAIFANSDPDTYQTETTFAKFDEPMHVQVPTK